MVALRQKCAIQAHVQQFYLRCAPIQNDGVLVLASRIERTGRCTIELRQLLIRAWLICGGRLIRTRQRSKSHPGPPSLQHNVHTGENAGPGLNFQQSPAVRKLSCPEGFFSGQLVLRGTHITERERAEKAHNCGEACEFWCPPMPSLPR